MFYGSLSVPFQAVDITASFYSEENTTFWSALGINLSTLPLIVYNVSVWDIPESVFSKITSSSTINLSLSSLEELQ